MPSDSAPWNIVFPGFFGNNPMQDVWLNELGLFGSAFISSTLAPGGSEAMLAYMVTTGQHPVVWLIAVATIGNTLGAMTTWWLGVWTSKKYPAEQVLSKNNQKSIDRVRRWGGWTLFFSWLPVVGDGLCFAGGWLRLSLATSLLAIFLGKAIRYTVIACMSVAWVESLSASP